ncbi:hypothetical protein PACTADRAFT_17304 [Pachysolen tannophilus NRRL Y-2460]|uniref:Uncharacterized protein n=1 Tax=Pachysolen tannophilus NRRL Y-2460 TaxID=669874 RepID=A0A1E4TSG9_PACTA|nr:hypothetical protein PACTADRAFT_17304 [Pachysolen tannophilus NRRL Y-2460]
MRNGQVIGAIIGTLIGFVIFLMLFLWLLWVYFVEIVSDDYNRISVRLRPGRVKSLNKINSESKEEADVGMGDDQLTTIPNEGTNLRSEGECEQEREVGETPYAMTNRDYSRTLNREDDLIEENSYLQLLDDELFFTKDCYSNRLIRIGMIVVCIKPYIAKTKDEFSLTTGDLIRLLKIFKIKESNRKTNNQYDQSPKPWSLEMGGDVHSQQPKATEEGEGGGGGGEEEEVNKDEQEEDCEIIMGQGILLDSYLEMRGSNLTIFSKLQPNNSGITTATTAPANMKSYSSSNNNLLRDNQFSSSQIAVDDLNNTTFIKNFPMKYVSLESTVIQAALEQNSEASVTRNDTNSSQ